MPELKLQCFHCKTVVTLTQGVPFSLTCEKCQTYLHSCGNCRHYVGGQCQEPEARATPDPGMRNTCDWYMPRPFDPAAAQPGAPGTQGASAKEDPRAKLAKLFGDPPPGPSKPRNPFGDK